MLGGIRAIRNQARTALHRAMSFPAVYVEYPGAAPLPVTVRLHTKDIQQGDVKGTSFGYAEIEETDPFLVFLRSDVPEPRRGATVSVGPDEAYKLDHIMEPDGLTVKAKVTVMAEQEALTLFALGG